MFMSNQSVSSWEVLDSSGSVGSKRSHDYSSGVDAFVNDMKKRRVDPSYDSREWDLILRFIWFIALRYGRASRRYCIWSNRQF